jgi:lauroyl/myristoyl acyltransferase
MTAPLMPGFAVDALATMLAKCGPVTPVLAGMVRRNMVSAGVYRRGVISAYFAQVSRHFAGAAHIFRLASRPEKVAALARAQVEVDASVGHIREALGQNKGAIIIPPHVCNYLLTLTRLNQEIPICVYLRWSENPRRQEMKRAWCAAAGLEVILEPASATDPTSRAAACVEALRSGKALVMTPDIAQKSDKGLAVRLLNREVYLPSGPASIAMLAEAPIVPVFGKLVGERHVITAQAAIIVETSGEKSKSQIPARRDEKSKQEEEGDGGAEATAGRGRGWRKTLLAGAMQRWADGFELFLKEYPEAWFLWGDSRWTKVFQGDPRYSCAHPNKAAAMASETFPISEAE